MSLNTGITKGTPARILFGAGVYFTGATYDPLVAPTEADVKTKILGATQDGGTFAITPELYTPELDGATVKVKELQVKVGETATMETSFAELTAEAVMHTALGAVSESTDKEFDVITSSETLLPGHYYSGFGWWGHLLDGREAIIIYKNALCTSGFATDAKNKTNSIFKGTFECHASAGDSVNKLPYAVFIRKKTGFEVASENELYAGATA